MYVQATCSEAEAGKRLADALAAADEAQQAVQQQHSLNADLQEQLQALHQQLAQVSALRECPELALLLVST
jgi:hypothetical protein